MPVHLLRFRVLLLVLAVALALPVLSVLSVTALAQDGDGDGNDTTPLLDATSIGHLTAAGQLLMVSPDGIRVLAARDGFATDARFNHWMLPDYGQQAVREDRVDKVIAALRALRVGEKVAEVGGEDLDVDRKVFERFGVVEQTANVVALHYYGGFERAVDDQGAPEIDKEGNPLFRAALLPIVAIAISPADDNGQRYMRIARPAEDDPAMMQFGPGVWRVEGVTDLLLDTAPRSWLDLSLVNRELRNVDPTHFYRVQAMGGSRNLAWQRFGGQPRTVNEWQRMYLRKGLWRETAAGHTLFTDQLGTPVTQQPIARLIDAATSLTATNFLGEVNDDAPLAKEPHLRLTLFHLGSYNGIVQITEHDLVTMLWVYLAEHAHGTQSTTMTIGQLAIDSAEYIPAMLLPDLIGREISAGWIRPIEVTDSDPDDIPMVRLLYPGGELKVKALEWQVDAVQRVREMQTDFPKLIPESIRAAGQMLNKVRDEFLKLPPNAPAGRRDQLRRQISELQQRYDDTVVARFGQMIDLWIERIPVDGEERYRVATNTTNPPFRYWYEIAVDDVKALETQLDAVKKDPTLKLPDAEKEFMGAQLAVPQGDQLRIVSDDENPMVRIETNFGNVVIELLEDEAPNTVANFIELVEKKFYDGTQSHRIRPGFVIQAGCPTTRAGLTAGAGGGGPGYRFKDEAPNDRQFDTGGLVAMANSGPDTNGSQFFITLAPLPQLDSVVDNNGQVVRHYTIFGRIVQGQAVVSRIASVPVAPHETINGGERSVPQQPVIINRAVVIQKRDHDYKVTGKIPE